MRLGRIVRSEGEGKKISKRNTDYEDGGSLLNVKEHVLKGGNVFL